jgi:hypothetical protein
MKIISEEEDDFGIANVNREANANGNGVKFDSGIDNGNGVVSGDGRNGNLLPVAEVTLRKKKKKVGGGSSSTKGGGGGSEKQRFDYGKISLKKSCICSSNSTLKFLLLETI